MPCVMLSDHKLSHSAKTKSHHQDMATGDEKQTGGKEDNELMKGSRRQDIRWGTTLGCWAASFIDVSIREGLEGMLGANVWQESFFFFVVV